MFNVAIVGAGLIGRRRAECIRHLSDGNGDFGRLLLCCDVDFEKAQHIASQCGAHALTNWEEVVRDPRVDIVVVSTINKYLAPISIEALNNGKHVLCEKPMGRNLQEAEEIFQAARANGLTLKTGFNHRHHPAIAEAAKLAARGDIGEVYYLRCRYGHGGRPGYEREWRADQDLCGGGELLDQGVHAVDLFRWFMGDFQEAFGYVATCFWDMPVEDNAFALFKTPDGRVASMHTSWTQWKNVFSFEIFGKSGYLIVDGLGGSYGVETLRIGLRQRASEAGEEPAYLGGAPIEETIVYEGPDVSWELEWREFISAIKDRREPLGSGRDGLEANRMIDAVYRSSRERRLVEIQMV